jgi:hypothetical protein
MKLIVRGALVAALVFATAGSLAADKQDKVVAPPPAAEMTVYDTQLGEGWENWSWAKAELSVELAGSPRKPIKVEAAGWQALYLHHAPFNSTGLKKIDFLIQGSAPAGEVRLFMLTEGKPNGEGKVVKLSNTGWTKVEVPLVNIAADDKQIDGIWLQNASADPLPKFFVTEMRIQ